ERTPPQPRTAEPRGGTDLPGNLRRLLPAEPARACGGGRSLAPGALPARLHRPRGCTPCPTFPVHPRPHLRPARRPPRAAPGPPRPGRTGSSVTGPEIASSLSGTEVTSKRAWRGRTGPGPGMDPAAEHRQQLRSESCLDSCAARLVRANHRLMGAYVGLVPALLQRRAAEHGAPVEPSALPASPDSDPGPAESLPDAPAAGT
uniref:Uncharacterized protein n=1 Tax=Malurus cyaneus samueli TaxID=2593467 RepID=A0A8C5T3T4_9PASS